MRQLSLRILNACLLVTTFGWVPFPVAAVESPPISFENFLLESRAQRGPIKKGDKPVLPNIERSQLFHLALEEAYLQGIPVEPDVRHKINQVIYQAFLDRNLNIFDRGPTSRELMAAYEKNPLIRLRYLRLKVTNPTQRRRVLRTIEKITRRLSAGHSFKSLVLQYSQDESVRHAGDLDFRGAHSLPSDIYRLGLSLKKKQVSLPLEKNQSFHFIQLLDRKTFADAPASYLAYLKGYEKIKDDEKKLFSLLTELKERHSRNPEVP